MKTTTIKAEGVTVTVEVQGNTRGITAYFLGQLLSVALVGNQKQARGIIDWAKAAGVEDIVVDHKEEIDLDLDESLYRELVTPQR